MATFFSLLLRILLLAAGLVFAASIAFAFVLLALAWALRVAWAKLTGKPVMPFVVRMHPRQGFESMMRRGVQPSRTPRADAIVPSRRSVADVVDVEPKG